MPRVPALIHAIRPLIGLLVSALLLAATAQAAPRAALIGDLRPGPASSAPAILGVVDGAVIFTADDGAAERGIWRTDGTAAGTRLLKAVDTVLPGWVPVGRGTVNGVLLFDGVGTELGDELWRTDGTVAGTGPVADITPGAAGSFPSMFSPLGAHAKLFTALDAGRRAELWRTDGTTAGTSRVYPGFLGQGVALGGRAYFVYGGGLWRSDGTATGTRRITVVPSAAGGPVVAGHTIFFTATSGSGQGELWRSDGTAAGTRRVLLLHAGQHHWPIDAPLVALGSSIILTTRHANTPVVELWRSDGTSRGTRRVLARSPGRLAGGYGVAGGRVFFAGRDQRGRGLWVTDGTAAGTRPVHLQDPVRSFGAVVLGTAGRAVYFSAGDVRSGRELWSTTGTARSTRRLADILPGPGSSDPGSVTRLGDRLVLAAQDAAHGRELWRVTP